MTNELFKALKEVMKSKGIGYKELSSSIGMSESGLKKIMAGQDCSLAKLEKICDSLGLSFNDLVILSSNQSKRIVLNQKQEELFLRKPSYYHFFIELINLQYDWRKVASKHHIDEATCTSVLVALDQIGLIELHPENRVKRVFDGGDVSISAKLGELVSWDIDKAFFKHAKSEFKAKKRTSSGSRGHYKLKKESLDELIQAVGDVFQEFAKRSKREQLLNRDEDLLEVGMIALVAQGFRASDHMKF